MLYPPLREKEAIRIGRYYTCPNVHCDWYRDLVENASVRATRIFVPNVGWLTYKGLADRDVRMHNCNVYAMSVNHVRTWVRAGKS